MESAIFSRPPIRLSPPLLRRFSTTSLPSSFSRPRCTLNANPPTPNHRFLASFACHYFLLRAPSPAFARVGSLAPVSTAPQPAAFGSGGGGDGAAGGTGGGGGEGGFGGGGGKTKSLAGEPEEVSVAAADVIVLEVGGMTCGGCAASVKRILESQPQVASASVNLATETAVIWVKPEVHGIQNWKQQVGEKLANHLTTCGFESHLRGQNIIAEGDNSVLGIKMF